MEEGDREIKICFWNIAGLTNKCEETWDYLEKFNIIGLTETWMEEETWKRMCNKVSKNYNWYCIPATKENTKGRAKSNCGCSKQIYKRGKNKRIE